MPAPINAKFTVDTREFNRALATYMKTTKKDLADVLNMKGYKIALAASHFTRRADAHKIANELGIKLRTVTKGKRKGRPTMN